MILYIGFIINDIVGFLSSVCLQIGLRDSDACFVFEAFICTPVYIY